MVAVGKGVVVPVAVAVRARCHGAAVGEGVMVLLLWP